LKAFQFINRLGGAKQNSMTHSGFDRHRTFSFQISNDDSSIVRKEVRVLSRKRELSVVSTTSFRKSKAEGKIMINQYIVEKTLGQGSFAVVKLCRDSVTGQKYAIKQMNKKLLQKKKMGIGKNAYQSVVAELKVLQLLEHPNIIWLNEIIDDPKKDTLYVVTDWYVRGSLGDLIDLKNKNKTAKVGLPVA
jgi:serine/threonine protein kinase